MTFKSTLVTAICLATISGTGAADPYCAAMLSKDSLEKRYQRLAPIHNSTETGWIFGSDQLSYRYVLTETEQALLTHLVDELAAHGTRLAMMIAPPRPVIAGQAVVDATFATSESHDVAAQAKAFDEMMAQIANAGVIAPNLHQTALEQQASGTPFYFQRDTHWTNTGAAIGADLLSRALDPSGNPSFDVAQLPIIEMFKERGSLSDIAVATCDMTIEPEQSPLFDYSALLPQADGLFGDVDAGKPAVLLGTSFSDRYGRDQYQAADALSAALGRTVDNHSVSGGGMTGPFEGYILSGSFTKDAPDLLVWEFPYTYQLNETALRQVLGALSADDAATRFQSVTFDGRKVEMQAIDPPLLQDRLGLRMVNGTTRDLTVYLHLSDGEQTRLRLRRKKRVEDLADVDTWWIDLRALDAEVIGLSFETRGDGDLQTLELLTPSTSG